MRLPARRNLIGLLFIIFSMFVLGVILPSSAPSHAARVATSR
jgi:hypothetical protein